MVSNADHDPARTEIVRRMGGTLAHRGPDGAGAAQLLGCDLAFRRLAIVDLAAPSPPFANEDGTIVSVCNGEIYNGAELADWLTGRGHRLRTHVDTEVLPHLYEEMGDDCVDRLDGMFAFALWDNRRRRLFAGRDRAGEKPLCYWHDGDRLAFASELRALLAIPGMPRDLDAVALRRFLMHDYVPSPASPLAAVRKLPAGHVMSFHEGRLELRRYWDLARWYSAPAVATSDLEHAAAELDGRIADAVRRRRRADVPVGVFLSGGLDSATILAHHAEQQGGGVPAFGVGFADADFDESRFARETARRLGADLEVLTLAESDLETGLHRIAALMDEPLGDASIIPTFLLSEFARARVKVVLSGEGGDELFAGYPTYFGDRIAEIWRRVPGPARAAIAQVARWAAPRSMGNVGLDYLLERFLPAAQRPRLERHVCWFGGLGPERHRAILAPELLDRLEGDDPFGSARDRLAGRVLRDPLSILLYLDFGLYLQDDLLVKVDRASMLASLEARAPFLDHALAEYAASLPSSLKVRGMATKVVLRRAAARRVPPEVIHRRKRGFNIPFSRWLLHGLGERMRERFSQTRVRERGLFNPAGVSALIDEHLERRADHRRPLFSLLVFDLWCDRVFGEGAHVPVAPVREGVR